MESLGIDVKLLIAQAINFALFFYIFKRFVSKPFSKFLHIEVEKEKEKEKILNDLKKKEEDFAKQQEKMKVKLKSEVDEALKSAKSEAAQLRDELTSEAKKEADAIIIRGRRQIEEERAKMLKDTKNQVGQLSLVVVNKALVNFLTPEMQKKVTQQIIKNLPKDLPKKD